VIVWLLYSNRGAAVFVVEHGIASWYGPKYHGRQTASGETFDQMAMTAAHKKLKFNTKVRVVDKDTGNSVTVRINDRGPFVAGRIIDLSKGAASKLGILEKGLANVKLEVLA
jgi:rare lipoprotein A